ncbi:MAG: murein biosynthesis integral membrane protein MurJ [Anaerolineales bacterium]|nr:murein biosynthesis integral membrane protein MurJ [Anaerolineales bacterium]
MALSRNVRIASLILAASFLLSALLGMVRQAIIGAAFGAGADLDAFYAAYRIPEMLFTLVVGGALGSAFIPVFSRFWGQDDQTSAWRLARAVLTYVTLVATVVAGLAILIAPLITATILIPQAPAAQQALTSDLMRIILLTVVIFSLSGLMMGILNANHHFVAPALAPSLNNIGMIVGAVFLTRAMGVYGLAWGAVLGALLHFGVQLPALSRVASAMRPFVSFDWHAPGLREVLILMIPRLIGSAAVQINFVVNTALASGLETGSLTWITVAFSLMFVTLGVIGQSVGTAIFPTLSRLGAKDDLSDFRAALSGALQNVLFTAIPAGVGVFLMAYPLVATIYQRGEWSSFDSEQTAAALAIFAIGLPAFALQEILARAFFALRDTLTPVIVAVVGMLINVALSLTLVAFIQTMPSSGLGGIAAPKPFVGLALANVIATYLETAALWLFLRRRIGVVGGGNMWSGVLRASVAAAVMGGIVYAVRNTLPTTERYTVTLLIGGGVGSVVYGAGMFLLGAPEMQRLVGVVLRRRGNRG